MPNLNTGLTSEQVMDAFYRALHDYTDEQILSLLAGKQNTLTFDDEPTASSDNPVKSKGIKSYVDTGLSGKQDTLTFDSTPTANSDNPVKSKGIKNYVDSAVTSETTAREAESGVIANAGAKNLCPYNSASATAAASTPIDNQPINLPAGTYVMTYTQTATTGASSIRFSYNGASVTNFTINNDSTLTKSKEFTLASPANQIKIYTSVINDYTEIMIRRKEISDASYQPYAPTNRELYEMILALQ